MNYKNKSFMTKRKAFTLIELLIVIAIIGILFIVLVSKVDFATDKAKATGVQTDFRSFQVAIESVAKENAGLATFGWDTGDTNGNRIRDSYDKGDTNKNGQQDTGEVFVGSKTYGETWSNVYTLTNPADADDKSAIAALEEAINKNLDPKLHITINDDLTITMANGAQDPWKNEYHGYYITNATVDNKDRGAIVIYSNGANQEFGSEHSIAGGVVTVNVPGNNVYGKDDYGMSVIYTYVNGYGEIKTTTSGFSVNQGGGQAGTDIPDSPVAPQPGGGTGSLPTPNHSSSPIAYSWSELKTLAQANLSADELRDTYGIEVGDYKEVDGVKYILVDLDGNSYDGFVFMFATGVRDQMNSFRSNSGTYFASELRQTVDQYYASMNSEIKSAMKTVQVTCISGYSTITKTTQETALFLPGVEEVGREKYAYDTTKYELEGEKFDYFIKSNDSPEANALRAGFGNGWWTRTADVYDSQLFAYSFNGQICNTSSDNQFVDIVACFVIGDQVPSVVVPTPGDGTGSLPTPNLNGAVANSSSPIAYEWFELKTLAQANLSADELRDTYGIEVGDYKEVDGIKYVLVDLDGNNYDGFVFMYNSGGKLAMNSTDINKGGYVSTEVMKPYVDGLYDGLSNDLKSAIKKVTITCNSGKINADDIEDNGMSTYTTEAYMFLASLKEVGITVSGYQYAAEGSAFDYFSAGTQTVRKNFAILTNIPSTWTWWLRSANSPYAFTFYCVYYAGNYESNFASYLGMVVPAFVIG